MIQLKNCRHRVMNLNNQIRKVKNNINIIESKRKKVKEEP